MTNEIDNFKEGKSAAKYYYNAIYPSTKNKNVKAEDAIRFFLPPVEEQPVQISMPLPKARQKWIAGFKKEQIKILSELE